jgi:hypothetical protein
MDYKRIYNNLIEKAKRRATHIGYTEMHHIIPKCMGGTNVAENLIRLTAREHFIAHACLYKHYKTSKLAHAWFSMLRCRPSQKRFFTSRQYAAARKAHSDALKKDLLGANNHFYGKRHTKETKLKISIANKGRIKSAAEVQNWVEKVASKPKSTEHKAKIGRKGFVMLQNIETKQTIRVLKTDVTTYDRNVWKNPAVINPKVASCSYCSITSNLMNIKRWHNENCKHKKSRSTTCL